MAAGQNLKKRQKGKEKRRKSRRKVIHRHNII